MKRRFARKQNKPKFFRKGEFSLKLFKKPRQGAASPQTAHTLSARSGLPKSIGMGHDLRLYESVRSAVPIIDAAILKIIRLIGGFSVECETNEAERRLKSFLETVPVGAVSSGINSFLAAHLDSLLTYGTAVGELVINEKTGEIAGLYNADLRDVNIEIGQNPFCPVITAAGESASAPHPERIFVSAINPTPKSPLGRSLLEGLPFISDILMKIFCCIGTNWERAGNIRYAVTYNPKDGAFGSLPEGCAEKIAEEWSAAMNDPTCVRDFVAVGDIAVKVIGADSQILDSKIPVQQLLEQIIAKTGLPPFTLGLSWSTTERMSSQQADILTSELEYYRSVLTPVIAKICRTYLQREGYFGAPEIIWDNISLQDEVDLARARLYNAQAALLEGQNGAKF